MSRPGAARAGIWLSIYGWGGSLVGVLGFGMLWRGFSSLQWPEALLGLGLLVLGLDRAGTAFAMSMRSRRAVAAKTRGHAVERGADGPRVTDRRRASSRLDA